MPLGTVNFAQAPSFEPLPAGDYDGVTGTWEPKPTKAGDSMNVEAKFVLTYEDPETNETRTRTVLNRWNLKPESLWRIKRDLVAMGADPSQFESTDVDLEAVLNSLFGAIPTPVTVTLVQRSYTPDGGEPRVQNDVSKVVLRSTD